MSSARRADLVGWARDADGWIIASTGAERAIADRAAAAGIMLFRLSAHFRGEANVHGFVLGFTRSPDHAWPAALRRVRAALADA